MLGSNLEFAKQKRIMINTVMIIITIIMDNQENECYAEF